MKGFAQTFLRTRHTVSPFFIDFFKSILKALLLETLLICAQQHRFGPERRHFLERRVVLGQNDIQGVH